MTLDNLFEKMLADRPAGGGHIDLDGMTVYFTKRPDGKITPHRVQYSAEYVTKLLQIRTAELLGLINPQQIMVSPQIESYEDAELTGFACVPSDRAS